MIVEIDKKKIFHYILIYMMILMNGSQLFYQIKSSSIIYIIIGFYIIMQVLSFESRSIWSIMAGIILLAFTIFQRYFVGGVGLSVYLTWAIHIFSASTAVFFDKEHFVDRYINVGVFMAAVSLVFYGLSLINLTFAESLTFFDAEFENTTMQGLFLYTFNPWHLDRNTSIFLEPGSYQILLNSVLVCCFFFPRNSLYEDDKKTSLKEILIIVAAILTTQSTTGYIAMVVIFIFMMFSKYDVVHQNKFRYAVLALIAVCALLIQNQIAGENGIINSVLSSKLTNSSGELSVESGTGVWRLMVIQSCVGSLIQNPLGVGYDVAQAQLAEGSAGGIIMISAAAMGIVWFIFVMFWIFRPIVKSDLSIAVKILLILLYFNTALAQSQEFYTGLICFTFMCECGLEKRYSYEEDYAPDIVS